MWLIIVMFLWMLLFISLAIQYAGAMQNLSTGEQCMCLLIFLITAPAFFICNIATWSLDILLGEGWDNDEDDFIK